LTPATARLLRRAGRGACLAGIFLGVIAVRVVTSSRAELLSGDALMAAGDADVAIPHYRRAARWYAPLNPYTARALDALAEIAREAEASNEHARALAAHRAIRAAILSTRSLYTPHSDALEAADRHIAMLMAREEPPPIEAELSARERERSYLSLLRRSPGPSKPWSVIAIFGFVLWVSAAFAFSHRAIDPNDRIVRPIALRFSALWAVGFCLFCLGLALA
jgi:hypothetical protein